MNQKMILTIGGLVAIVGGCVALYFAGASEVMITALVGGVFVLIGLIAAFFGVKGK
jgi:uncharacterized membrane protein HdeD (DUF308 family)